MQTGRRRRLFGLALLALGAVLAVVLLAWRPERPAPPPVPRSRGLPVEVEPAEPALAERPAPDPAPIAEEPPPPAPAEPAPDPVVPPRRVHVRDLATGAPVSGLDLLVGERPVTTDDEGFAEVPADETGEVKLVADGELRLARGRARSSTGYETAWTYRMMTVEGTVGGKSELVGLRFENVRLIATHGQGLDPGSGPRLETMARIGLHMLRLTRQLEPDGSLRLVLPRVPGFRLVASCVGWDPGSAILSTEAYQNVTLRLSKQSLRVRGVLLDSTGAPLAGRVELCVVAEMPAAEVDLGEIGSKGLAYTLVTSRSTGRARLTYVHAVRAGPDGRFDTPLSVTGRLYVSARPDGDFHPAFADVELEDDVDSLVLRANSGNGGLVRVLRNGTPFRGTILFLDHSRKQRPVLNVRLESESGFPASYLEPGHRYTVRIPADFGRPRGRLGISLAELLRRSLRSVLPDDPSKPWMRLCGMVESGDPESSRRVDEIVYGRKD